MDSKTDSTEASTAHLPGRLVRRIARLGRFLIFLGTAGWAFPHACTEDLDLTRIQNEHSAKQG